MRLWRILVVVPSALIIVILTHTCACAEEDKVEDNLVTTYDPGETSSELPIGPRLPHYDEIAAGDQPDHHPGNHGQIRFEDDTPSSPVKFQNNISDIKNTDTRADLENISFDGDQNDRILTPNDHFEGSDNKDFEEPHPLPPEPEFSDSDETDDQDLEPENDTGQLPPNDSEKPGENDSDLEDIDAEEDDTEDLEDTHDAERPDSEKEDDKSSVTERISFAQDSKKEPKEPVKKKRLSRRKPRVHSPPEESTTMTQNAPFPGFGYPGYMGGGYPPHGYPGDPSAAYPGFQHGYPPPYPGFGGYPTPYPSPYPTPGYPGYPTYQPGYPGYPPGYGSYPTYQNPGDSRPQMTPAAHSGQSDDQVTQADTKYPAQEYPGAAPGTVPGRPGAYAGQDYAGAGYSGYPAQAGYPGYSGYGYAADPNSQYGQNRPYSGYPGYYRPPRRPKSLTQRALSAVAEALTSIALFDDKQCVPRLLCEVASGSTASSPALQKATAGLGPLLTVLQSYNGLSSSPLFVFGRAAVLGMTSKGNPTSCRYAYSQCPNDPESLISYLNNHNGGFFRFFGQPEGSSQQQNLEQFYNHLSGQYGYVQQQSQQQQQPYQQTQQQNYGYGYGMPNPYPQNYGPNYYREQNTFRNAKEIDSETALSNIEERIQNKPGTDVIEEDTKDQGSKWTFPDEASNSKKENKPKRERKQKAKRPRPTERPNRGERGGGTLKFPDDKGPSEPNPDIDREREFIRTQKGIFFPSPNHFNIQTNYPATPPVDLQEYVFDYKHNFYVKRPKQPEKTDDTQTVYIVRGNGDPNHPEVVKVKPGQTP